MNQRGVSVIEVLIAFAVILIAFVALVGIFTLSLRAGTVREQTLEADAFAREALEAARSFRNQTEWAVDGLGTLTLGSDYHPAVSGSEWDMAAGAETIGIFSRSIVFEAVARDGSDMIVESGGVVDPDSKKVTATISWQDRGEEYEIRYETLLTNY